MPKITSVEPQKKDFRRFNIFLDGEFAFGADEDLVVNRRLMVGKELNPSDIEQIIKEAEVGKLMERMYRLFNIRQRSEKEVIDYLKNLSFKRKAKEQEGISAFIVDTIVSTLKESRLINDEQFAQSWVDARKKKKGPRVIKQELFQKGIDKEIIEGVISSQAADYDGQIVAEQLLEKKMRVWKNLPKMELKKKAYDFLLRRGFEYEIVKDIIEKIMKKEYDITRESDEE